MIRPTFLAIALAITANSAIAAGLTDLVKAREISQVVAASPACGYDFDKGLVERFIRDELVNMDDMVRVSFQTSGLATASELEIASADERATTCMLMESIAAKYGLLR